MATVSNSNLPLHSIQKYPHLYEHRHSDFNNSRRRQSTEVQNRPIPAAQTFDIGTAVNDTPIDSLPDDLMQSEHWGAAFAPTLSKMGRSTHQRESSLSSLGSTGPASPYNHNTSNPQIAITDSGSDGLSEIHESDNSHNHGGGGYYHLSKPMSGGSYSGYQNMDGTMSEMAYPITIPGPNDSHMSTKPRSEQRSSLLPAPEFPSSSRSHPASVASSVADDSPATPTLNEAELVDKRRKGRRRNVPDILSESENSHHAAGYGDVPKLGRTLTDVYSDELYSPNFAITSTSPSQPAVSAPNMEVFRQRLSAANTQHLNDGNSPVSSATRNIRTSPFRAGSPHAPGIDNHSLSQRSAQFNSARHMREHEKAQKDAQFYQHQVAKPGTDTPNTISPKDAMLELNDPEGDSQFPLFPAESSNFDMGNLPKLPMVSQAMPTHHTGHQLNYLPQMPMAVPHQFHFLGRQPGDYSPSRVGSAGSSESAGSIVQRPINTFAGSGTYTCTYHGCPLRFETPALLQKHKREGHRHPQALGRPHEMNGVSSNLMNSQAGPHKCDRINPSTGKPCDTVFSRPYDLTRHEDTIHNARKQKVRCNICTEEKTFSRADALTRHYRVCHPDQELPSKHRRRGGC